MPDIQSELAICSMPDIRSMPTIFLIQGSDEMSRDDLGLQQLEVFHVYAGYLVHAGYSVRACYLVHAGYPVHA